jgi:MinD-like ATPase involved in chromosome partitioning or flagellar assembly
VESTLSRKIDFQIPDDWKALSTSINMGVPLAECAQRSRARQAIREMAEQIVDPEGPAEEQEHGKGGLFGRIFSGAAS